MTCPIIHEEEDGDRAKEVPGRGGLGVVHKAEGVHLSRTVAPTRIDSALANDGSCAALASKCARRDRQLLHRGGTRLVPNGGRAIKRHRVCRWGTLDADFGLAKVHRPDFEQAVPQGEVVFQPDVANVTPAPVKRAR